MQKVFNRETIIEERLRNAHATHAVIFEGNASDNLHAQGNPKKIVNNIVKMTNANYVCSEGYHKLWNEIEDIQKRCNAAQAPSSADLVALLGKVFIDITRRAQEAPDLTSLLATEVTNFEFSETVNTNEFWPYRGKFKEIAGTNDSVPLIEQSLGEVDTVNMTIRALGWKDSIKNMLFNKVYNMQKVIQAVVDADTDQRNSLTVGKIVAATYVASQKQAADATSGATYDVLMYNTFRKAIKKIRGLKDYRTDRPIAVPSLAVLCNSADSWSISRAIGGQLQTGGTNGTLTTINASALPINQIIEYDGGINNGFAWGKEIMSYPGVTAGKAYLLVPREYLWVLNKRPLTMETGRGSVLQLSTEERAWYRVQAEFDKIFFGSSYSGTALGASYGAVLEVTLPTDS